MGEKIFLKCSAKEKTFSNGGTILNLGIKAEDMQQFLQAHTNERGYLNLTVQSRREVGKFGDTHTVSLDTWVAKPKGEAVNEPDIPF